MDLRPLGNSGLMVTPLGLGLAALGRPGYINLGHAQDLNHDYDVRAMEAHAHGVLDAAWAAGIRYLDAARSYGRAEAFLSSWLVSREIAPQKVTVGSKWGYTYTADWQVTAEKHEVKEHSRAVLDRQLGESLALLGDQLDLYQIHSATLDSGALDNSAVLSRLAELRERGLAIGLSTSGPNQAETILRALEVEIDGRALFATVQSTWNLLAQEAGPALRQAHEAGLGIIVKEALANGRLTARNDDPAFAPQRRLLEQQANAQRTTVDALALAAVLAQPWVDVVLSGAAQVDHLLSNVMSLAVEQGVWSAELTENLREQPEDYWRTRSAMAWN